MKQLSTEAKRAFGIAGAIALLAGCSGGTQSALSPSSGTIPNAGHVAGQAVRGSISPTAIKGVVRTTKSTGKSWSTVSPNGKIPLLYVTNTGTGTVTFYTYNNGKVNPKLRGTLTGFAFPGQPCSDTSGNVFIPDYVLNETVEYAHGATTPTQTLTTGGTGCSVDKTTGNLAVANFPNGTIAVYPGATGTPTDYSFSGVAEYVGYDNAGNLFVNGQPGGNIGELPSGGSTITSVTLSGFSINFPSNIQNGGTYLLVGSQGNGASESSYVVQTTLSGTTLTAHGTSTFPEAGTDITGFWKSGSVPNAYIAGADNFINNNVDINTFPAQTPVTTLTNGVSSPFGTTVSR